MRGAQLYLLLEEAHRELRARVLIATLAARRGFVVTLLSQHEAWSNAGLLERGIMLFKGYDTVQTQNMAVARKHGHVCAVIDEESIGLATEEQLGRLVHPRTPAVADLVLAQGEGQRRMLEAKFGDAAPDCVVVGNPRFDFLAGPLAEPLRVTAAAQRERHGDYLLINSNFGSANPHHGDALTNFQLCVDTGYVDPGRAESVAEFFEWCRWERGNLAGLLATVAELRRRSFAWRIIIRPHPSERLSFWRNAFDGVEGIDVIREGDHLAWTAGARALLHTSCTTGLEARIVGTPAISLTTAGSRWDTNALANEVNALARSPEAAADALEALVETGTFPAAAVAHTKDRMARHLYFPTDRLSADLVVDALVDLARQKGIGVDERPGRTGGGPIVAFGGQGESRKIDPKLHNPRWIANEAAKYVSMLGFGRVPEVTEVATGVIRIADNSGLATAA